MDLVTLFQLKQLPLFVEGFSKDFGHFSVRVGAHLFCRTFMRSGWLDGKVWVATSVPVHLAVLARVEVRAPCRPVSFFHTEPINHALIVFAHSCWNTRTFLIVLPQSWENSIVQNVSVCWGIKTTLPWRQRARSEFWKTAPHHYPSPMDLLLQSAHSSRQLTFVQHLPNPDSSVWLPNREVWVITPDGPFPLLAVQRFVCFTPLHLTFGKALDDVGLANSYSAMGTHSMKLLPHSFCCFIRFLLLNVTCGHSELFSDGITRELTTFTHHSP